MTTILKNFVTVRKNRGDVMSPAEYRSILEAIRAIIKKYNFSGLNRDYRALLAHLINFDNPHHDDQVSFFDEIVSKTYDIYVNMLANPVSLDVFKTDIVPTLKFLELIRRIVLNRFLYDQVKTDTGSVPYSANVYISSEWQTGIPVGISNVIFGQNVDSEIDFIKLGWNVNTAPIALVFNANDLYVPSKDLPIVYQTSSDTHDLATEPTAVTSPSAISIGTNDLTIQFQVMETPPSQKTVFTLRSPADTLFVRIDTDKSISVINNNSLLIKTDPGLSDGKVELLISSKNRIALRVEQLGKITFLNRNFTFGNTNPFTTLTLGVQYEDLLAGSFGLRSLVVLYGLTYEIPL